MESIAEIVKNLLVIIIVTSFLELLLPEGGLRPFVRFAIGLFIIITVLNPILSFIFDKNAFEIQWWDTSSLRNQVSEINSAGQNLNQEISKFGNREFKEKIEGQISALVLLVPGVQESHTRVEIDNDGAVQSAEITVSPGLRQAEENGGRAAFQEAQKLNEDEIEAIKLKINDLVKNLYGFENVEIKVLFEGS